jgi:peptidoglycan/LPS O-acetylase OafA/YrhL
MAKLTHKIFVTNLSHTNMKPVHYRPDIDGLRAIAVMAVIFYHLGAQYLPGGFIGVDIFFVISGYLITSIIAREIKEQRFSLLQFWERRVRRIFPALFAVLAATTIAAYVIFLYPNDFLEFGRSLLTQSIFLINIFFMRQEDYFAASPDTLPLLHTWSLAVEEQFYLFFPILLLLLFRWRRAWLLPTLTVLTVASFLLSVYFSVYTPGYSFTIPGLPHVWGGATHATAAFYLLPTRAWELLMGALLAITALRPQSLIRAEILAHIGLILLTLSILMTTESLPFPGFIALLPVIGTSLLIYANSAHKTTVATILSYKPIVGIGLISYALYLWHWPIIVFSHYLTFTIPTVLLNTTILSLTGVLAVLTYHYIETPFRHRKILAKRSHLFLVAAVGLGIFFSIGLYIHTNHGLPERAPESASVVASAVADINPRRYECFQNNYRQLTPGSDPCLMGTSQALDEVSFILWGDSQADTLMPAFDKAAEELGVTGAFFAIGGCAPLLHTQTLSTDAKCEQLKHAVTSFVASNNITHIFIIGAWSPTYTTADGTIIALDNLLKETIATLNKDGLRITLIDTPPNQPTYNDRQAFLELARGKSSSFTSISTEQYLHIHADIHDILRKFATSGISVLFPHETLCETDTCTLIDADNKILYRDATHLNTYGAMKLHPMVRAAFLEN